MYRSPSLEIIGNFEPETLIGLIEEFGVDRRLPYYQLADREWVRGLRTIAGRRCSEIRLNLYSRYSDNDRLNGTRLWHPDTIVRRNDKIGSRLLIAGYPIAAQVVAGCVPGLPSIKHDKGYALLNNVSGDRLQEKIAESIEEGDAWPLDLTPGKVYCLAPAVLHRSPPIDETTEDRLVVNALIDYATEYKII